MLLSLEPPVQITNLPNQPDDPPGVRRFNLTVKLDLDAITPRPTRPIDLAYELLLAIHSYITHVTNPRYAGVCRSDPKEMEVFEL